MPVYERDLKSVYRGGSLKQHVLEDSNIEMQMIDLGTQGLNARTSVSVVTLEKGNQLPGIFHWPLGWNDVVCSLFDTVAWQ